MTKEKLDYLKECLKLNKGISNKKIASAIVKDKESPYYGYSKGSVANYLGTANKAIKAELASSPIAGIAAGAPKVETSVPSMAGTKPAKVAFTPDEPEPLFVAIMGPIGEKYSRAGAINLLVEASGMTVGECEDMLDDATDDNPLVFAVPAMTQNAVMEELYGYGYRVGAATPATDVETEPDTLPSSTHQERPTDAPTSNLPFHYDVLVVSVKDEPAYHDWSQYTKTFVGGCNPLVIVYGNEAREAEYTKSGKILFAAGGIGGLEESYALYDAIDSAIASVYRKCENPSETDVNITIVTDRGVDFGSRFATKESVRDVISRVRYKFGWSVNLMTLNGDATNIAVDLGIDSSNAINYTRGSEAVAIASHGRKTRNVKLSNETASSVGYFK